VIEQLDDAFVGDTGPYLRLKILDFDGYTTRNLTNYVAQIAFWYNNADPHWVWVAQFETYNPGVLNYFFTGNEYTQVGIINRVRGMLPTQQGHVCQEVRCELTRGFV